MAANVGGGIGLDDHGHGVPTDDALDAAFDFAIAGKRGLVGRGNGVDVRRGHAEPRPGRGAQFFRKLFQQMRGALRTGVLERHFENGLERLGPFVAVGTAH